MSNIQEIDGVFVNLDLVKYIETMDIDDDYRLRFLFDEIGVGNRAYPMSTKKEGYIKYETQELAKERIREIIKMQNGFQRKII